MAIFTVTYADGSSCKISFEGSAEMLFEQLFSACSDDIRAKTKVEETPTTETKASVKSKK